MYLYMSDIHSLLDVVDYLRWSYGRFFINNLSWQKIFPNHLFCFFFQEFFFQEKAIGLSPILFVLVVVSFAYLVLFFSFFIYKTFFAYEKILVEPHLLPPINLYWNCVDDGGGRQKFQNKVYIYVLMTMVIKYLKIKYIYVYYLLGICWLQYENQFVWAVIQSLVG
eukprot:TRINITY_DN953_c2_g1_i1.p4 TRINITY_DN953_c2_g1~~TRINITY_DN953_c2_g1_i1.p4  ORF type:complete len:166 (-),score=1.12 TRINITY_DN953_c2_g1_i1:124-621(-)